MDWFILLESSGTKEMEDLSFCESCVAAGLWKIWINTVRNEGFSTYLGIFILEQ